MAVSGIFGLRNLQKLVVTVRFPDEIYCNVPALLTLQLATKRTYLPHYLLTLTIRDSKVLFHLLSPGSRLEKKIGLTFTQRGMESIGKAAITSPFPVNFFIRSTIYTLNESCLVFPEPLPLPADRSDEVALATGNSTAHNKGSGTDTGSINTYTEAEPLKQIHWKLSARHDELLVKEMSADSGKPVIIELDRLPGDLEQRLGHATFLINGLIRDGRRVGLKIGPMTIPADSSRGHRIKMLTELARYAAD